MAQQVIKLKLPTLRQHQYELYDLMRRFNAWVCHRRLGKTVLSLEILVAKACSNTLGDPRYAYFAPTRVQAKDIAWLYLTRFVEQIPGVDINQSELRVTLPTGAQIRLYGTDNYKLGAGRRGMYFDGVVLDEYADIAPSVWTQVIRPALSDRLGWAIFLGTPRGKNHFYHLYQYALWHPEWSTALLRADHTGIIDPDELASARDLMSQAEFAQEYLCSWDAPMPGAVYAEQLARMDESGRVTRVAYDPRLPTYTAWDIGPAHTAIWWLQPVGDQVRVIDYEEGPGSLPQWIERVRSKPYQYDHSKLNPPLTRSSHEVHYGPHDLEYQDYSYGKTRYTIALEHGLRFTVLGRGSVEDGLEAGRRLMDHAVIDEVTCEEGVNALRSYRYDWDEQRQTYRTVPVHDWASHGADAWRYAAIGLMPPPSPVRQKAPEHSFDWWGKQIDRVQQGLTIEGVWNGRTR